MFRTLLGCMLALLAVSATADSSVTVCGSKIPRDKGTIPAGDFRLSLRQGNEARQGGRTKRLSRASARP